MKLERKQKLIVEPAAVATGDIAFNLIVFFLVCASVSPDQGRPQEIPRSEKQETKTQNTQNIEVALSPKVNVIQVNGSPVSLIDFPARIHRDLATRSDPSDRVVVVKSEKNTPYAHWIEVTGLIEDAGGSITVQLEEEQVVQE